MATWQGRKTRPVARPYEVWEGSGPLEGWTWKILKKNQSDDSKPYATAFCAVSSPHTFGGTDMGDTYIADYANSPYTRKVSEDYSD